MNKFVIFFALLSVAASAPAPGYLGGYVLPAATSYSSRVDVHHSKPIIHTYAAPIVTKTLVAAPILPAVSVHHASPIIADYGYGLGHGYDGLGLGHHGYGYGHGW